MAKSKSGTDESMFDCEDAAENSGISFLVDDDFMLIKVIGAIPQSDVEKCIDAASMIREFDGVIEVWIDSEGGAVAPALILCGALLETKADTKATIFTSAYSGAAWIAGCCDSLKIHVYSQMLFHKPYSSFPDFATTSNVETAMKEVEYISSVACVNFIGGFMTSKEMAQYTNGLDVIIGAYTIQERWPAHKDKLRKLKSQYKTIELS